VKEHTNITITSIEGPDPCVRTPSINKNHILRNNDKKKFLNQAEFDDESDINKLYKSKNTDKLFGALMFKTNRVSGIYAEIEFHIYFPFPKAHFLWTPEERAAIFIHEVGHIWGFFEMANRTVSTNQVLYDIAVSKTGKVSPDTRKDYYIQLKEDIGLTDEDVKDIEKDATNGVVTQAIVIKAVLRMTESELGFSVYDSTSNEQLADMYSIRCGSRKHLATALDKGYDPSNTFFIKAMLLVAELLFILVWGTLSLGMLPLFIMLGLHEGNSKVEYDNVEYRLLRQKQQLVEELKRTNRDDKDLIDSIDTIDTLLKKHTSLFMITTGVAELINKKYRDQMKSERLQKDLESLASNQLFVQSARLVSGV
jgi:hypothetical protein